jgi:hypothetical protein
MTLSENIAAREAIIPQIKKLDERITDLTYEESKITHEMSVSKNFRLLKDLERISKEIRTLKAEADRLDKRHYALIKESIQLSKALLQH